MKRLIFISCLLFSTICLAQNIQQEIDKQVWVAFTKAWETKDGEAYNAIHSDDVWRINPGRLLVGDEYKSSNAERMQGQSKSSIIEFSFETRTANGDNAYEVGYYRITSNEGDTPQYFVGRFHVALRKIDGSWKITQDWDTPEINGEKITPESLQDRTFRHFE